MKTRLNSIPLGVKLNNPLNIRYSAQNQWLGLSRRAPECKGFCRFTDVSYGYRAAILLMLRYMRSYGLKTPSGIVYRWAPPSENKTALYLATVCAFAGLDQDEEMDDLCQELLQLVAAMARIETGLRPDVTYLMDLCEEYNIK